MPAAGGSAAAVAAATLLSSWALADLPGYRFAQITTQPYGFGMFEPSISADGRRVAFRSTANLAGQNVGGNFEIFLYDKVLGTTIQLTETPGGIGNFTPMIAPAGDRVVFKSLYDFTGEGNAGTFELWEVDVKSRAVRQVTDNPVGKPVFDPRLSGDGEHAVFVSRINPAGQNEDGSEEVFRINVKTGALIQISSNAASSAQQPDINGDGSRIVWVDRANYDGSNPNGGLEVWLWDEATGYAHVTAQQSSVLETALPRIDHAGRYVSFISLFDFSGAGVIGRKVFLADTERGGLTLLTNPGVGGAGLEYPDAQIAPDGSAVYFESNKDLLGMNSDLNRELYAYDIAQGVLDQITVTTGGYSIAQLSNDAKRNYLDVSLSNAVAYRSEQDLDANYSNDLANLDLFSSAGVGLLCAADLDGNGVVDSADLGVFFASWSGGGDADLNGDGAVDGVDLGMLLGDWGPCG